MVPINNIRMFVTIFIFYNCQTKLNIINKLNL